MASNGTKELNNGMRIYDIKRRNTLPYVGKISVLILNHQENKQLVDDIERDLKVYNIEIKKDISELDSYYDDEIRVFDEVRYMIVLVSEPFLKDWTIMKVLLDSYQIGENNNNIIPLIVQDVLYDPKEKARILRFLQEYSKEYVNEFFINDFDDDVPKELEKMQRIIKMAKDFLNFSLKRDKKSNTSMGQKIIKYIESDMGINLINAGNTSCQKGDSNMDEQGRVINHFHGTVNNLQMQQGNDNAKQTQTFNKSIFDYEAVEKIVEEIKKNSNELDSIYGEKVNKVCEILSEVTLLAEEKKEPEKIKNALLTLKDLSIGVSGSLIASGIVSMISNLGL